MGEGINLTAIIIADLMGVILTGVTLAGCSWRFRQRVPESRPLLYLIVFVLLSCVADTVSFIFDGKPGTLARIAVIASNTWLYEMNMVTGLCWISFLSAHLHIRVAKAHILLLFGISAVCTVMLTVNLFVPFVFSVDSGNVYHRTGLFALYLILDFIFLADGFVLYLLARKKGGILSFFPVWLFVVPVALGMIIQSRNYGISAIWPFISISVSGMIIGLQNEQVFRDQLTGLYSRFYLDYLKRRNHGKRMVLTAMMLDLDGFKTINDRYGHKAGDEALIAAAEIMNSSVGTLGSVIRYAGDEFIILLNTRDQDQIDRCIADIRGGMEEYNRTTDKTFRLSVSVGTCPLDMAKDSVDDFLSTVDRRMYEGKRSSVSSDTHASF
ncbi:MAG: GGDEF domain-containing protein [Clostridia bacterium]|nr:GGDEF domain-containing protein [Clostridia bacterium]